MRSIDGAKLISNNIHYIPPDHFAQVAAKKILSSLARTQLREVKSIFLTGGKTINCIYRELSKNCDFDWSEIKIFWSDERCVNPSSIDSNYRNAFVNFLTALQPPKKNIYRILGELNYLESASHYDKILKTIFRSPIRPGLMIFSVGEDGHCASIFPNSNAFTEKNCYAAPVIVNSLHSHRVTLTYEFIMSAHEIVFILSGENKRQVIESLIHENSKIRWSPVYKLMKQHQNTILLTDIKV